MILDLSTIPVLCTVAEHSTFSKYSITKQLYTSEGEGVVGWLRWESMRWGNAIPALLQNQYRGITLPTMVKRNQNAVINW